MDARRTLTVCDCCGIETLGESLCVDCHEAETFDWNAEEYSKEEDPDAN